MGGPYAARLPACKSRRAILKYLIPVLVVLLLLPALPAAAQERCVQNQTSLNAQEAQELSDLRNIESIRGLDSSEQARLRALERAAVQWAVRVGLGNGWVSAGSNSCVLHYGSSGNPVMGTLLYLLGSSAGVAAPAPVAAGVDGQAQQAIVIRGPARIRSGPGLTHANLGWCGIQQPLTVWTPAQGGWLQASCYGVNGWIYASLVQVSG